ncbi:MAG: energy-coupling factor transporter transmembrane component T [Smithellaceae bacterium]|nr:energy-coupling factor transporter transmembrane component T [Smithellaceae bacterium]
MRRTIPPFLLQNDAPTSAATGSVSNSFLEKGIRQIASVIGTGYAQWEIASGEGLFHRLNARIKVLFLLAFIIVVSLKKQVLPEAAIGCFVIGLAALSKIDMISYLKKVAFFAFFFGLLIALPAGLNIITPGEVILPLFGLREAHTFWIYRIPQEIGFTRGGLTAVTLLTLRVMNSIALSFLVLYTTAFPEIIRALKVFRVPDFFLVTLNLTYKYIFLFAKTVEQMYLAKKGRLMAAESAAEGRRWIVGRMAFIFRKTQLRCEDLFKAMQARGFADEVKIHGFTPLTAGDWFAGALLAAAGVSFLML